MTVDVDCELTITFDPTTNNSDLDFTQRLTLGPLGNRIAGSTQCFFSLGDMMSRLELELTSPPTRVD